MGRSDGLSFADWLFSDREISEIQIQDILDLEFRNFRGSSNFEASVGIDLPSFCGRKYQFFSLWNVSRRETQIIDVCYVERARDVTRLIIPISEQIPLYFRERDCTRSLSATRDLVKGKRNKSLANSVAGDDRRMLFPS